MVTEYGVGDEWTKVEAKTREIVCNIEVLLMSWSDHDQSQVNISPDQGAM